MEPLIYLFVLFSIVSWLLERRKKAKQLEEQRRRHEQQQQREQQSSPPQAEVEEEVEEVGWPFGGDLFEVEQPHPPESQAEAAERETLTSEREALAAERRAMEVERMVLETVKQVRGQQPRQRMSDLLRERAAQEQAESSRPLRIGKWKIDPQKARDAIVYAEILGKPKAERTEER